jgi:hypothetical protein
MSGGYRKPQSSAAEEPQSPGDAAISRRNSHDELTPYQQWQLTHTCTLRAAHRLAACEACVEGPPEELCNEIENRIIAQELADRILGRQPPWYASPSSTVAMSPSGTFGMSAPLPLFATRLPQGMK